MLSQFWSNMPDIAAEGKRDVNCEISVALVRHPRPEVPPGICYGRLDLALHKDAPAQIEAAVHVLRSFAPACIWSSPALRCQAMARALAQAHAAPLHHDARLQEMDFGAWEGLPWNDVPRNALDLWAANPLAFAAPGGESGAELMARISAFHRDIVARGQSCVVVAHGGPLKLLRPLLLGAPVNLMAPSMPIGGVEIITVPAG